MESNGKSIGWHASTIALFTKLGLRPSTPRVHFLSFSLPFLSLLHSFFLDFLEKHTLVSIYEVVHITQRDNTLNILQLHHG